MYINLVLSNWLGDLVYAGLDNTTAVNNIRNIYPDFSD